MFDTLNLRSSLPLLTGLLCATAVILGSFELLCVGTVFGGLYAAALIGSFAFTRLAPAWHVHWSWDRLALIPVAVMLPVLAEALAECVQGKSAPVPPSASPVASPRESPAPAP